MVKIRLSRVGAKKRPYYRVVAIDERARRVSREVPAERSVAERVQRTSIAPNQSASSWMG